MAVRMKSKSKQPTTKPKAGRRQEEEDDDLYEDDDDDDDEEEARPRNTKSSKSKTSSKRRSRSDDDDDEEEEDDPVLGSGWGSHHRNKAETSNYPNKLELKEEPQLVLFLDDEPLVSFKQHWIERKGKKSFYCLGKECPLCAMGDKPKVQNIFNVVKLDEGEPVVLVLQTGVKLTDQLESKSQKSKLSRGYWGLGRTGTGGTTNFDVVRVKERDLEEDWDAEPLDEDQIKKLRSSKWKQRDTVQINTRKELLAIAKEQTGDYAEDDDDDE